MAQEIEHLSRGRMTGASLGPFGSSLSSEFDRDRPFGRMEDAGLSSLHLSGALLNALGDEPSRRILHSAIATGKTIEAISAEQALPLSTCYRRVRQFVDNGLMLLERMVVTPTGKRYGVYRTSFSKASVCFDGGEVSLEVTPNPDVVERLRRRWLSAISQTQNQEGQLSRRGREFRSDAQARSPFE